MDKSDLDGTMTELVITSYAKNETIIFCKIVDEEFREYMEIIYTKNGECAKPIYFKWKNIPPAIYTIYLYTKKFTKITYNKNTDIYEVYGTRLYTRSDEAVLLASFKGDKFPINNKMFYVVIEKHNLKDTKTITEDEMTILDDFTNIMLSYKKFPKHLIRGPSM